MPRARNVPATRKRHQRVKRQAKGYFGNASRLYRYAKQAVDRAGVYAYRDRKVRKREFRRLWITRLNAACRAEGMSYSRFIAGIHAAGIQLDRKQLSEMAIHDPEGFKAVLGKAKDALGKTAEA